LANEIEPNARECGTYPAFYRQLGRNPEKAVAADIAALPELHPAVAARRPLTAQGD
jgi:hypothetical protein